MSSDNGMGSTSSVAAAPEARGPREEGGMTAGASTGSARPQTRRGEDGQSKGNGDDEELSRRQASEEGGRGQAGRGTR